jgi:hypothetical protein
MFIFLLYNTFKAFTFNMAVIDTLIIIIILVFIDILLMIKIYAND